MTNDDAWGDLFAKAADVSPSKRTEESTNGHLNPTITNKKARKRKRKRSSEQSILNTTKDGELETMLESRINPLNSNASWPDWMQLGGSLCGHNVCKEWHESDCSKIDDKPDIKRRLCKACGKSPFYHQIRPSDRSIAAHEDGAWPLVSFLILRNLRCCASLLTRSIVSPKRLRRTILRDSDTLSSLKPLLWIHLPEAEAQILEAKLSDVLRSCNLLVSKKHLEKPSDSSKDADRDRKTLLFELAVKLMITCDALYYRTYYLQVAGALPRFVGPKGKRCFLPHPPDYFGLQYLTIDTALEEISDSSLKSSKGRLMENESLLGGLDKEQEVFNAYENPLASIHQLRHCETAMIFEQTGWIKSANTIRKTFLSLEHIGEDEDIKHETPAADVLMSWRDSCRDFLCNLYAYATLSSKVLQQVVNFVNAKNLRILEIGAGTGYLARLLREGGADVDAWDIHPTNDRKSCSCNEYHGKTPPFCLVRKSGKLPLNDCTGIALLLCYPPPGSTMALSTLNAYLAAGGRHLIHVGEFKGLTGNSDFEHRVIDQMNCTFRGSCMTWGTDASHITIWEKRKRCAVTAESPDLLLPCVHCKRVEAQKRCRLLRTLVYCSERCFDDSRHVRKRMLQLQMIILGENQLSFSDPRHFLSLV